MRGRAIALVKSFVGLGGEVVAQLFVLCYGSKKSDPTSFNALILWAVISVGCTILAASVVPTARDVNSLEPHGLLRLIFWELFVLGFFSVGIAFLPDGMLHNALVVVMVLLALAPIALAVFTPDDKPPHAAASCGTDSLEACAHAEGVQRTSGGSDGRAVPSSPSASSHAVPAGQPLLSLRQEGCRTECLTGYHRSLNGHPQHTDDADADLRSDADIFETTTPRMLFPMLATPEAWLILLTGAVVVGGGNLIATSISQIVSACGGQHGTSGQRRRLPCVARLCSTGSAHISRLLRGGLSFGAMWPHLVLLSSEIFGSKNLSVNYMFLDGSCAAFGTLVFANFLPRLYNRAPPGSEKCVGSGCFGPTHLIVACLGLLGVLSAILTARSSALLYQKIGHSMRMS
ncbi:hypothetical protein AB1Y20_000919 [Prymnesium parvum]|uniref:Nodulin-like domain-containing protein n=1 Tax=Prymnesium parvum TaxID=97485 RepID=A0AB34KA27_PRYPA